MPCLSDNYAYLVAREGSSNAIVIDASEAEPVVRASEREGLRIAAIFATHHHHDHVGGHEAMLERDPGLRVYGHASENARIPRLSHTLRDGDVTTAAGLTIRALHVPGHTLGALAYSIDDAVFTGDTLFLAGCGRLFEGTPAMMLASLEKIAALPEATRVYCGHEYTVKNLEFARAVDPGNDAVRERLDRVKRTRATGAPSVPGTIREERVTNPFLRARTPEIGARYPARNGAVEVFAALRREKDTFR